MISREFDADDDDEEEEEEEEEDRSLDLLVKFLENLFKKVSWKARKAVRSVLPVSISNNLVVCILGSVVFVSNLLVRGVWTGVMYLQEDHNHRVDELDVENHVWTGCTACCLKYPLLEENFKG